MVGTLVGTLSPLADRPFLTPTATSSRVTDRSCTRVAEFAGGSSNLGTSGARNRGRRHHQLLRPEQSCDVSPGPPERSSTPSVALGTLRPDPAHRVASGYFTDAGLAWLPLLRFVRIIVA